jgi:hypothetical protein
MDPLTPVGAGADAVVVAGVLAHPAANTTIAAADTASVLLVIACLLWDGLHSPRLYGRVRYA